MSLCSDVSLSLGEFSLTPPPVVYLPHSSCYTVNSASTALTVVCKRLAYEVMDFTLTSSSFPLILLCRWFTLYVAVFCVCVCGG